MSVPPAATQSGGGGTFHDSRARLRVEYVVRAGGDPEVTVRDTRSSRELLQGAGSTAQADRAVSLED